MDHSHDGCGDVVGDGLYPCGADIDLRSMYRRSMYRRSMTIDYKCIYV